MPALKLTEITPEKLGEIDNKELFVSHGDLHKWWNEGLFDEETLFAAHEFVVEEMGKRKIGHDTLLLSGDRGKGKVEEKQANSFPDPESLFNSFPDKLILVPEFVSLSGSFVDDHESAEDIEVIVKAAENETGFTQTAVKLPRALMKEVNGSLNFVSSPQGAFFNYVPTFDLALVKRAGCEFRNVDGDLELTKADTIKQDEPEKGKIELGKPYLTSKAVTGFFDFDELFNNWADARFKAGSKIHVEKKHDGIKGSIHRNGDDVKIFTEDAAQDIAWKLPELIPAIKAQTPQKYIAEAELVQYDDKGNPKSRQDMAALFAGKEPVRDFKAHVYDLLLLDDEKLTEKEFSERRKLLDDNLKTSEIFEVIPSRVAKNKDELKRAVNIVSKEIGSEGAMLKDSKGPYELDGSTDWQSKIKNIVEIDARVIGFRKQPLPKTSAFPKGKKPNAEEMVKALPDLLKGSNTYVYRVAVFGPEGKEIPIEADKALTEADLKNIWDADKQEWRGLDDPELWTMARGWPERNQGEIAYGNTLAAQLAPRPKLGDIITVDPGEITEFKPGQFSWTFPTVQNVKPDAVLPGDIRELEIIKKEVAEKQQAPEAEKKKPILVIKEIAKADYYHRYLLGVIMIPNYSDTDGDTITEEEIRKSESAFVNNGARIGINHKGLTGSLILAKSIVLDEPKTFINIQGKSKKYPKGTWLAKVEVSNDTIGNEIWQRAKSGEITGFSYESIEGLKVLES